MVSMLLGPSDMVLMMTGFQRKLMTLIVIANVFRILLAILLVRQFGLLGIAIGWGGGAIIQSLFVWKMSVSCTGIKCNANYVSINAWSLFRK